MRLPDDRLLGGSAGLHDFGVPDALLMSFIDTDGGHWRNHKRSSQELLR